MFMKKFELTSETIINNGKTLYRIKALIDFSNIKAGELGGFVEKESNLNHKGNAWVYGNACVSGNARVSDNAWVYGNADYTTISGFGTRFRTTTFFKCSDKKIRVNCGCFYGTIDEFREQVNKTRTGKIAKEYLLIADLMEEHFKED